jgi:hypothetical protein
MRVAAALHRRAARSFVSSAPKKGELLETLAADGRRLAELEQALVKLSPSHRGLRAELLTPMAQRYAHESLSTFSSPGSTSWRAPFRRSMNTHLGAPSEALPHNFVRTCGGSR